MNLVSATWYNNSWAYRIKVTVEDEKVTADLTNFPVMVNLNSLPTNFWENVKSTGADIVVTDNGGSTKLSRELESINTGSSNAGILWFKAASLSSTDNSEFYIYYGNVSGSETNDTTTWSDNYTIVSHLNDTPTGAANDINDSVNNYEGDSKNSMGADSVNTGKIGNALYFRSYASQYIDYGDVTQMNSVSTYSYSYWVKSVYMYICLSKGGAWSSVRRLYYDGSAYNFYPTQETHYGQETYAFNADWHHVVAVFNGNLSGTSRYKLYIDGAVRTWDTASGDSNGTTGTGSNLYLGYDEVSSYYTNAVHDEFRVASSALSADWIATEYNNQNSPATFYSVGSPEANPTDLIAPSISSLSPADDSTYISISTDLTLVMNDNLDTMTGNLTIKKLSDDSTVQTISITAATGNGTTTLVFNPSDLAYNTSYYINIANGAIHDDADNNYGGISDNGTWNFTTAPETGTWWNGSWGYRQKITIPPASVNGDLVNFPVMVDLNDMNANFWTNVKSDGADIVVTDKYAVKLKRELEEIDTGTNNAGILWFKAASLSSTSNNDFYLYYGYASGAETNDTTTWSDNYAVVSHLDDTPTGSANDIDDSVNNYEGDSAGSMNSTSLNTGKIGNGLYLNSMSSQHINYGDVNQLDSVSAYSYSYWVKSISQYITVSKSSDHSKSLHYDGSAYTFYPTQSMNYGSETYGFDSNWHHIVAVYNGDLSGTSRYKLYIDGAERTWDSTSGTAGTTTSSDANDLYLGYDPAGPNYTRAIFDEFRVSTAGHSSAWIKTEYDNQNAPGSFYTIAAEETGTDTTDPTVSTLSPADNATGVAVAANLVITFDEAVDVESGNVTLKKTAGDVLVEAIDVTGGLVTGTGTTTITINPTSDLDTSTEYYVLIDATAFDDAASNSYAGIASTTAWSFTTTAGGDVTNPSVSTLSPADGATGVARATNLVITFDEAVDTQTGNITIKKLSDDSTVETIPVGDARVTGNGTTTITINPNNGLLALTSYYINIATTAFDDAAGNSYAGITNNGTWNFTTVIADPWSNASWSKRVEFTVDATKVNGDLTDFPIYLDLSDFSSKDIFNNIRSDGGDLRVTQGDGLSLLPMELVKIDTTNNLGELWFKTPFLSSSVDTRFYLYYNNPNGTLLNADHPLGKHAVWSNGFVAVYHMQEDPNGDPADAIQNSVSNQYHGTPSGTMTSADKVAGQVGNGTDLDGSDDYFSMGDSLDMSTNDWSLSTWLKTSETDQYAGIMGKPYYGVDVGRYSMYIGSGNKAAAMVNKSAGNVELAAGSTTVNNNTWHHVTSLFDRDVGIKLYVDGSYDGTQATSFDGEDFNTSNNFTIGYYTNYGSGYFDGIIDEARVSNKLRSADWIETEYNNQNSPSTFYTIASSVGSVNDNSYPKIASTYPANRYDRFPLAANLFVNFDENIQAGSGNITIKKVSDNSTVEAIAVGSTTISGVRMTINPTSSLVKDTEYYILIDSGAVEDTSSNIFQGITTADGWRFKTEAGKSTTNSPFNMFMHGE